jgi:mono/diheme cytochrome c family protein
MEHGFVKIDLLALLALALALVACVGSGSADTAAQPDQRAAGHGERQFRLSCAGCHGVDARGNGPIAPVLSAPVPDLTLIASRHGGRFPDEDVYRIIDGQADLSAHGPRHMPVWGYEFFADDPDDEVAHRKATEKIDRVVSYLRSIQRTP